MSSVIENYDDFLPGEITAKHGRENGTERKDNTSVNMKRKKLLNKKQNVRGEKVET